MRRTTTGDAVTVRGRVHQNPYLPVGSGEVHAVLDLETSGPEEQAAQRAAEVLVLDESGSMERDGRRERAVRAGTAAVEQIRDGALFAVVGGNHTVRLLWPPSGGLRVADARSRADAVRAIRTLRTEGGTAIGSWLRYARTLLGAHPTALRHVTLLTDGRNEHETRDELDAAVEECLGVLTADCRGIGVAVEPAELHSVAERLSGSLGLVVDDDRDLAADFAAVMARTMARRLELELQLWTPRQGVVRALRQLTPQIADLQPLTSDTAGGVTSYQLGGWGSETRRYHLCIEVEVPDLAPPQAAREDGLPAVLAELLVGRVRVQARHAADGGPALVQSYRQPEPGGTTSEHDRGRIRALWTDDGAAALRIDEEVARARGHLDLALDLRRGLDEWRTGDREQADAILSDVRRRAGEMGAEQLRDRLDQLYDEHSGRFALDARDELEMFEESTKTRLLDG